ncbi:DUF5819 family protein [Streptomyces sp. PmtG]
MRSPSATSAASSCCAFDRQGPLRRGEAFDQVQVRSRTAGVRPPKWSDEKVDAKPVLRLLPWWSVTSDDMPLADDARAKRDVAAEGRPRAPEGSPQ